MENSIIEDVVVGVVCGLIAVPLCEASWHAIVVESEIARGIAGLAFGIPIGVFGFTFHWWKGKLQRVADAAVYWWPIAIVLAFGYVANPSIAIRERPEGAGRTEERKRKPKKASLANSAAICAGSCCTERS